MKLIESRDNPLFKTLRKWADAQGRAGVPVLLEGAHVCETWLDRYGAPQYCLFDQDRVHDARLARLVAAVAPDQVRVMPARLLKLLGDTPSDQGVRFVVNPPVSVVPQALQDNAVLLDRVQDPGNVGTILRACAASGVARVMLSPGCAAAWSPKVVRSAQGAHFSLCIHEQVDLIETVRTAAVPVLVTTLEDAGELYQAELPATAAWVFGHEGQGVSAALQAMATQRIRIDHERSAVESLNVAMAATLCLFEHRRRRLS